MIPVFASVRAPSLIVIITEDVVHSDHECPFLAEAVEELFSRPSRAILIRGDGKIRNNYSGSPLH